MATSDLLKAYKAKRNFSVTSEPAEGGVANEAALSFVIQKHWASRLHYDFRLELDGAMKSWAVPKGPSFDPSQKRMAVHVEDHPISYNTFEGQIPAKQYGAGKVIIWDKGFWLPLEDPRKAYKAGRLKFELRGHKLQGRWTLVRMKSDAKKQEPWLLIKEKDEFARPFAEYSVVDELPDSVAALDLPALSLPDQKDTSETRGAVMPKDAKKIALPESFQPQLATLVDAPPNDAGAWLYEVKFDGYRILARVDDKRIKLFTRNANDWTSKLPHLVKALSAMKLKSGWLDGEITVLNDKGIPDFQALQGAFDSAKTANIVYFLFDIPFCDGHDLRSAPLTERRRILKNLFDESVSDVIRFSDVFEQSANAVIDSACRIGLEGIIGKRKNSTYTSRRSTDWIKLKCSRRQEFVIGGYTDPKGSRSGIGSLLLGVYDESGALNYAGNVGSGFNVKTLKDIKQKLDAIAATENPFASVKGIDRKAHWVKPSLVAEVSFAEWTQGNHIRQGVFRGLRVDKKPNAIMREKPVHPPTTSKSKTSFSSIPSNLHITNPERIVDPSTGAKKIELVRYYGLVAPLILDHLKGRPVSLVRAPNGITDELFFQKHLEASMPGVNRLDPSLDPGHAPLMEVATLEALLSAAQMNVIEFHTWNASKMAIDKPDRMTFDLDPGEGVPWSMMLTCTELVRTLLDELGLVSFAKTSGGKGFHVVVPIRRLHGWDAVKDFSQAIVQHLAKTLPQYFVAKSGPRNRTGKIFVDYLRNGFGATTVAAWSVRARPGLGVSVPVEWSEVRSLSSAAQWNVSNIHTRLDVGNGAWSAYAGVRQSLSGAMKALGFKPPK
ncbi:MAG TPA: DNA ligase D [Rhodocyclaceae bacterium]|nr:DNA ligase D [Rhodocyclaceae bacterium]